MRSSFVVFVVSGALVLLAACGDGPDPLYGGVPITTESPRVVLTGTTHPTTPALELAPGCAGFVDPTAPEHVITIRERNKVGLTARSPDGPLALVIEGEDAFLCDSDQNTGHAPHVQIIEPGRYAVRVASLQSNQPLTYELMIGPDSKDDHAGGAAVAAAGVSVSITSEPAGALVRTTDGQTLGTTPAIFTLPDARPGDGRQHLFVIELDEHEPQTLTGIASGPEMVMHATLVRSGPRLVTVEAAEAQSITDFSTVRQSVTVAEDCSIQDLEVDVDIQHSYVGDLLVQLRSPSGTVATLHRYRGGARSNLQRTYALESSRGLRNFESQSARGEWQMTVRDSAELDIGNFNSFAMRITCAPPVRAGSTGTTGSTIGSATTTRRRGRATRRRQNANIRRALLQLQRRGGVAPPDRRQEVLDPWGP